MYDESQTIDQSQDFHTALDAGVDEVEMRHGKQVAEAVEAEVGIYLLRCSGAI
jgi:hypothetical protein